MRPTDRQLLEHLAGLRRRERTTCVEILLDLVKVERRNLHVALGYPSLFAFTTRHLGYSESAAGRRVQAARCVREHPEVIPLLRRGDVNLSTVSLVSRVLTTANRKTLLARITGKSQRQVELIVAEYAPSQRVRDRIQPVHAQRSQQDMTMTEAPAGALGLEAPGTRHGATETHSRSGSAGAGHATAHSNRGVTGAPTDAPTDDGRDMGSPSTAAETVFKIQFAASPGFVRKLDEVRTLLSSRFPKGAPMECVLEACMDAFLDRNSPVRRRARREAREIKRTSRMAARRDSQAVDRGPGRTPEHAAANGTGQRGVYAVERNSGREVGRNAGRAEGAQQHDDPSLASRLLPQREWSRRRAVPAAVRDAVFERDGGCCTFVGVDGHRCRSRHDVEIDHCQPVARGGTNTLDNLRLLCAVHNRLEAERVFGSGWMQRFGRS